MVLLILVRCQKFGCFLLFHTHLFFCLVSVLFFILHSQIAEEKTLDVLFFWFLLLLGYLTNLTAFSKFVFFQWSVGECVCVEGFCYYFIILGQQRSQRTGQLKSNYSIISCSLFHILLLLFMPSFWFKFLNLWFG